jgi:OPA family glycerol-3-phosphate transporter-like MFS transporter
MAGAVKEGLVLWGPSLLADLGKMGTERAFYFMSLVPLINVPFLILISFINRSRIGPKGAVVLFALLSFAAALLMQIAGGYSFFVLLLIFYMLMISVYVINNLTTNYIPMSYRNEGRISSTAGIIDSSFYLGAALAGPAAGAAADHFGWPGIFAGLTAACAAALAASVLMLRSGKPK